MAERSWARTRMEKPVRNDRFALLGEMLPPPPPPLLLVAVFPFRVGMSIPDRAGLGMGTSKGVESIAYLGLGV